MSTTSSMADSICRSVLPEMIEYKLDIISFSGQYVSILLNIFLYLYFVKYNAHLLTK